MSLGIRRIQEVNVALLEKLGRKLLTDPDNIWIYVVFAKYLPKVNFLETKKITKALIMGYIFGHRYLPGNAYAGSLAMVKLLTSDMMYG